MTSPDPNAWQSALGPYARYLPGFAFLQGLGAGVAPPASAAQWVVPVFDVEELERRIRDLKAVHFWLEQNARAVQATIQALEVQKLTLATLQGMNVSLGQVAQSLADAVAAVGSEHVAGGPSPSGSSGPPRSVVSGPAPASAAPGGTPGFGAAGAAESAPPASASDASTASATAAAPDIDPVRFWRALTEQFQTIAAQALQDMTLHAAQAAAAGLVGGAAAPASSPAPAASAEAGPHSPLSAPVPRADTEAAGGRSARGPRSARAKANPTQAGERPLAGASRRPAQASASGRPGVRPSAAVATAPAPAPHRRKPAA